MPMTAAQRQARYRRKRQAEGDARREYILSAEALAALERLCERWECSQSEAVERALALAERRKG